MYIAIRCLVCKHGIDGAPNLVRKRMKVHAHDYTDFHGIEGEFVIEEWTGDNDCKSGGFAMREDLRRVMRTGGKSSGNVVVDDVIREITEWHDAGQPAAEEILKRVRAGDWPATD